MKILVLILFFQTTQSDELEILRTSYLSPLKLEPQYVEKGETYINLSVIDIRLDNLNRALREAELAANYGRTDESLYLKGVIKYLKGNREEAVDCFGKINNWIYPYYLQYFYDLSLKNEILEKKFIPDTLKFYSILYESDTLRVRKFLDSAILKDWQKYSVRGYLNYLRDKKEKALNAFKQSYRLNNFDHTGLCIIVCLYNLNEFDSLIAFNSRNSIKSPLSRYLTAEALYKNDSVKKATELFLSDTLSLYREHALYGAGWGMYHMEKYNQSVKLFSRFLDFYKEGHLRQYAIYRLARALLKQGKIESLDYFKKLVREHPESTLMDDAHLLLGKIYFLINEFDESILWFQKLIENYPDSKWYPFALSYLGNIYTSEEKYEKALNQYNSILTLENASSDLIDESRYRIEEIKLKMGKYSTRLNMFKAFVNKYPESPRTPALLIRIAEYYMAAARYDRAIYYLNEVIKEYREYEEFPEALYNLARVYLLKGDSEKAIQMLNEFLKDSEDNEKIRLELADIYYDIEKPEKAIEHYRQIESPELLPYSQYQIGLIFFELGFFREARIPLENIINNYKKSNYFGKSHMLLAKTYLREGSIEESIRILDSGISNLNGKNRIPLMILKSEILCQMHDDKAIEIYMKIAEMSGEDIEETINILKKAKECAQKLNSSDRIKEIEDIIDVLETHSKND